jgi:CRP-like cAMP-binding protein
VPTKTIKLNDVLVYVPLFRGLSKRQLKHLAGMFEVQDYMPGASIVREGTSGDGFYVVLEGQAKVTNRGRFVARLVPGDHFGEIAALDGGERTATVTSETPMKVGVMTRTALRKALKDDPEIAPELASQLARMFRRVSKDASE